MAYSDHYWDVQASKGAVQSISLAPRNMHAHLTQDSVPEAPRMMLYRDVEREVTFGMIIGRRSVSRS